jgi:hypothetical protein
MERAEGDGDQLPVIFQRREWGISYKEDRRADLKMMAEADPYDGMMVRTREKLQTGEVEVNFGYQTLDNRQMSIDLKVGRGELTDDFWPRLRKALREEYIACFRGAAARLPSIEGK